MKLCLQRFTGLLLSVLLSGVPAAWAQSAEQQSAPAAATAPNAVPAAPVSSPTSGQAAELPDSPGYTQLQARAEPPAAAQNTDQQSVPSQPAPNPAPNSETQTQPPAQPQTEQAPAPSATPADQNPAGAAAAQRGKTAGGAASRPAGAALAPAKQRHPRSLLVKLGVVAGAGAALGAVFALSQAGGGRPPGAH